MNWFTKAIDKFIKNDIKQLEEHKLPPLVTESLNTHNKEYNDNYKMWCMFYDVCSQTLFDTNAQHLIAKTESGLELYGNMHYCKIHYNGVDLISFDFTNKDTFDDEPIFTQTHWVLKGLWSEHAYEEFSDYFREKRIKDKKEKQRIKESFENDIREKMKDYKPVITERYLSSDRISGDTTWC